MNIERKTAVPSKGRGIRPPVKWHGGKYYLWKWITDQFPKHHTYVEPFGGAASVLLNKPLSSVEVYNDLDGRITRLFRIIRDHGPELAKLLSLTPYSESEFELAQSPSPDEMEQARRDYVLWRLSVGGRAESFSFTLHRVRRGMADVVSGYLSAIDSQLPEIIERLRSVQILNRPAKAVIQMWDAADTLFYCDPPYVHTTRAHGSRDVYGVEMSEQEHCDLAKVLKQCSGKVVLSGYPSPLYDKLYADWRQISVDIANHAATGRKKAVKRETLWMNW